MNVQIEKLHSTECKCFSWSPIIAGAIMIVGLSFLLNLFSVAIGLTAFTTDSQGVENLAFGGLIATALGIIAVMFGSGWVTGYLGNRHCIKGHLGALYGFLAWCLALILTLLLAMPIKHYIVFYTHFISGSAMSSIAKAAPAISASPNQIMISTYIVFCLFFLSAFACSLGGHCGMRCTCHKED
jgi:hypothetical protein